MVTTLWITMNFMLGFVWGADAVHASRVKDERAVVALLVGNQLLLLKGRVARRRKEVCTDKMYRRYVRDNVSFSLTGRCCSWRFTVWLLERCYRLLH